MTQTVVGIFKTSNEARAAISQLLLNGFKEENVDISSGGLTDSDEVSSGKGHESGVSRFFRELFGGNNEESARYTNVGNRGTIITVHNRFYRRSLQSNCAA